MAKTANVAGFGTLSFPDETTDEVMDRAVQEAIAERDAGRRKEGARMAAEGMSIPQRMLTGAGAGAETVLKSVLPKSLEAKFGVGTSTGEDDELVNALGTAGKIGKFGGEVAATWFPAAKAAQVAGKVAPFLARAYPAAMVEGAASGAMTSPDSQGVGAGAGALGGAAGKAVLGKVLERTATPVPQLAAANQARQQGIPMTAGQGADPSTIAGRAYSGFEQLLANTPILGAALARKRAQGQQGWRQQAIDQALPPGMQRQPGTPEEQVQAIRRQMDQMVQQQQPPLPPVTGPQGALLTPRTPPPGPNLGQLQQPRANLAVLEDAVERAGGAGEFTPRRLRQIAHGAETDDLHQFARLGERFVQPKETSTRGTVLSLLALGGAGAGGLPGLAAYGGTAVGLSTELAQRAMRGDYAAQRVLAELLRKNPTLGATGGGIAGANVGENFQR